MPRPSWTEYYRAMAKVVSSRATCPRAHVGAILVSPKNFVIATGYNGAPAGQPHCDDVGCLIEDEHCQRSIHAEVNAITQAARQGHSTEGAWLYIFANNGYDGPCRECKKVIQAAGVTIG